MNADKKTQNDAFDPFDPINWRMSDEQLRDWQNNRWNGKAISSPGKVERYGKHPKFTFYQLPVAVLDALIEQHAGWRELAVLCALYEIWFVHPNHHNPVQLSSYTLRRFGISRWQKWKALQVLEKTKQIRVERMGKGKNPKVTLNWLRVVEPIH
jgi:hypothetical protein